MSLKIHGQRKLKTLTKSDVRPTTGRVREALFNIWRAEIPGCRFLDLCTGFGTMGAEALVRGAHWVVGVEQSAAQCQVIQTNWEQVGPGRFSVYRGTLPNVLLDLAQTEAPFDRVYCDPPYASGLYVPILAQIQALHLLNPGGCVACEHQGRQSPGPQRGWDLYDQRNYGSCGLSFYRLED